MLFTGNHDMWVGDYLARECGVELHTAPGEVTLAGKRLFLAHGDNMNIRRQPMLRLMNTLSAPARCGSSSRGWSIPIWR